MAEPFVTTQAQIQGDPVVALIAQINRIHERETFPLVPGPLTPAIAATAIVLLQTRSIAAAVADEYAAREVGELTQALSNPISYVAPRIALITEQLALYGDSLGRSAAKAGITKRDPRFHKKWGALQWTLAIGGIGAAALAAGFAAKRLAAR